MKKLIFILVTMLLLATFAEAQTINALFGLTNTGGTNSMGVLFEYIPSTNTYIKKIDFDGDSKGSFPYGSLTFIDDNKLYGVTYSGGSYDNGTIFEYNTATNTFTKIYDFNGTTNGGKPCGTLCKASNNKLYGMTLLGGTYDKGILFEYDPSTNIFLKKIDFDGPNYGDYPYGELIQAVDGKLYGMTYHGGVYDMGTIFQYDFINELLTKKIDFDGGNNGSTPFGSLMQATNEKMYGMTYYGGTNSEGVLFEYNPATSILTKKVDFDGINKGKNPAGNLMQASNGLLYGLTSDGGLFTAGVLFEFDPGTAAFSKKFDFDISTKGSNPYGTLTQALDGKLYGMTKRGGLNVLGVIFAYDFTTNTVSKKIDFNGLNYGSNPFYSSLLEVNVIAGVDENIANNLNLKINPNPAIDYAEFSYVLNENSAINLRIFDINGKELMIPVKVKQTKGKHSIKIATDELTKGMYFYLFDVNNILKSGKFEVLK